MLKSVRYTFQRRVWTGAFYGVWRPIAGSVFQYDSSQAAKVVCQNNNFSKFLIRMQEIIINEEHKNYNGLCFTIESRVVDICQMAPYRVFDIDLLVKVGGFSGWSHLKNSNYSIHQSDAEGVDLLNTNPDIDSFFQKIRGYFVSDTFRNFKAISADQVGLFFK
ncbi:MAG: hypothetical protein HWD91_06030 [Marivivens sp.]|uniref:hypothetical protein n=1 Tax=Marivivens sp. TaxID=1978374 RepID=UPI00184D6944|nr:hypothetical protein [Marivivens sp.]NVJ95127.1 hypothetical protein [Marivivens sp.]